MAEVGSAWISVLPDMRRFNTDVARGTSESATKSGKTFGQKFAATAAVGLAVFAAGRIFGGFIDDAQEAAKITRLTENAIRATGGAANVTAQQVADLSNSLSNKTAIDDALVQSGANLILTFKNIRNEAGAGNDVFNQTTEAALDLSAAGFGSVESASLQLGKALNDPLTGLTALTRSGVTFTEQQKDQIRVLTESGDLLGAQKIILEEIQGQVGGAAAAAADPIEKLHITMGNLGKEIGFVLLPIVEDIAGFIGDKFIPGIRELFSAFTSGKSTATGFAGVMGDVGVVLGNVVGFIKDNITWLGPLAVGIGAAVLAIKAWSAAQLVFNAVMSANPITLVITAIGLLVAAFIWAWNTSETFRDIVTGVLDVIGKLFMGVWDNFLHPVFSWIVDAAVNVGEFFSGMGDVIGRVWSAVGDALSAGWNWIKDNVFAPFVAAFDTIGRAFESFGGLVSQIWRNIQRIFVDAVNGVIGFINGFLDAINWVGEQVGLSFNLHIGYLPIPGLGPGIAGPGRPGLAFAAGGLVPGQGSGDIVPAWLTPGEIVIRKDIAKPFEDFLLALNSGQAEALQAAGGRNARGPQRFAAGGTVQGAQDWARRNSGKPYIWGGVGPNGWDCSGWQSDIANFLLGTPMGVRRFATGSMAGGVNAGGFLRGTENEYTIGVNTPGLVAAIGHTAGTLGGINVESGSGHGGIIGGNALGTNNGFAYKYYLPGSYGFNAGAEARAAQKHYAIPMSGGFSPHEMFAGVANWMMDQMAAPAEYGSGPWSSVGGRVGPASPRPYDQGGRFPQGTLGFNANGGVERVLTERQNRAFEALVAELEGGERTYRLLDGARVEAGRDGIFRLMDARIQLWADDKVRNNRSSQRVG